jgi:drug/metabolite transporter (DMT)-like permease
VHPTARDWTLLVVLALMWGTAFLATRVAVAGLPPTSVVAARLTLAALLIGLVLRARGTAWPSGPVWRYYAALGFFGNALPFLLISWGQVRVEAGLASILVAVMPLATLALAIRWVEGEHVTRGRVAGFGLGFVGLVVLVGPATLRQLSGEPSTAVRQGAIVLAAVSYAVNAILVRWAPPRPLLANTFGMVAAAALMVTPVALVGDASAVVRAPWEAGAAVLWLGVVSTAAASIVYLELIRSAGPTFFSLINYVVPLVATATGWLLLGERLEPRAGVALALILRRAACYGKTSSRPRVRSAADDAVQYSPVLTRISTSPFTSPVRRARGPRALKMTGPSSVTLKRANLRPLVGFESRGRLIGAL